MTLLSRFIPVLFVFSAASGAAETALDIYQANLKKADHSAQAQLLLSLTLQDCRSLSDIDGQDRFESMIDEGRALGFADFREWESDVRGRWAWCRNLVAEFCGEGYEDLEKEWLQKSVDGGFPLAILIDFQDRDSSWTFQRAMAQSGVEVELEVAQKPRLDHFLGLLRTSLVAAYESGEGRLKQAALYQVHVKFRRDEERIISAGGSDDPILTPQEEHELMALRSVNDEYPWEVLSCKYSRQCSEETMTEYLTKYFSDAEIQSFRETAVYYERCIEARDWVSLGLID